MKIIFYGGKQAGMISLLTILSRGHRPYVIPEDDIIEITALKHDLPIIKFNEIYAGFDLLICCHGRKKIPDDITKRNVCINIHPCLTRFKGADPIKRAIKAGEEIISVGCHRMSGDIDNGKVIKEFWKKRTGETIEEVYNELYPLYGEITLFILKNV